MFLMSGLHGIGDRLYKPAFPRGGGVGDLICGMSSWTRSIAIIIRRVVVLVWRAFPAGVFLACALTRGALSRRSFGSKSPVVGRHPGRGEGNGERD